MASAAENRPSGGIYVFDGAGNFHVWRARVESELLRHELLGYVRVRGYDGSQPFSHNGELVPAKKADGLSRWEALKEANDAMVIVQCSLAASVEEAILHKNVYESWAMLSALYGQVHNVSRTYRALTRMRLGEKSESTDSLRSAMLEQALPRSWQDDIEEWRGDRPAVPFAELVKRAIARDEQEHEKSRPRSPSRASSAQITLGNEAQLCFYCFRSNHAFTKCKYLENDIETGKTHEPRNRFSCLETGRRKPWMVEQLEAYVADVLMHARSRKRSRDIDLTRDEDESIRHRQLRLAFLRSRSVYSSASNCSPSRAERAARSRSIIRGRSKSNMRGDTSFFPSPRKQQCTPSFERHLGSPTLKHGRRAV